MARPLKARYRPDTPYSVRRQDCDCGTIRYEIFDERPESYRYVCATDDDCGRNRTAKADAENIARGLNLLVQKGIENASAAAPEQEGEAG